jgi:GMP synthase (glutamine-hydrolysing)
MKDAHLVVIDPAVRRPELSTLNWIALRAPFPVTYHLPALHGTKTLESEKQGIKGMVILGSLSSVNERAPWQKELEQWLMPKMQSAIPTFGICYGHQMIAHMFGGKVDYVFEDQKKHVGLREVELSADPLWENKVLKGRICVSHNEAVKEAPKEMHVVGKSPEVAIDALRHKQLPIWSFQSHPEAGDDFLVQRGVKHLVTDGELEFGYSLLGRFFDWVKR